MYNKNKLQVDNAKKLSTAKDVIYDLRGQWAHPGQVTRVPSPNITMRGVPYPVYGVGSNGQKQMMYPGQEYDFAGASYVDEYPQINRMRNGGILPQAQNGYITPTYADSLEVYNNAVQQQNYYNSLKKYYDKPKIWSGVADVVGVDQMKNIVNDHLTHRNVSKAEREKIKKGMLSNKYYMKDMITGALDPNAPLAIYDPRIKPQGIINYTPKDDIKDWALREKLLKKVEANPFIKSLLNGADSDTYNKIIVDNLSSKEGKEFLRIEKFRRERLLAIPGSFTELPYYSPLANKPATLLTNEEVKKRFKEFGPSGISKERLKSLGLIPESNNTTTTSTSRTSTPNIVKKEEPVLPEVVLDPSMFPEQQPIFDYVEPVAKASIAQKPGGITSYTTDKPGFYKNKWGKIVPYTNRQSQPHSVGYQRGGIASKDSLILSQNAQQALDYYKNRKYITDYAWKFDDTYDLYKDISSSYSDPNHYTQEAKRYMENPPLYKTGVNKGLPIPLSEYYKKRSPNTYYKREDKRSVLDTRSPMIMYDQRVKPQGNIFLINDIKGDPFYTDQVTFPTYDPIAITPWKNLSKEDQKKRLDIYGGAGTPFPRVKGNPDMIPQRLQDLYKYQKSNNPVVSDTTKVAPIYVESEDDPAYKAYSDSLALYNRGLEKVNYWKNNPNATNIELNIKENEIDKKYPVSKNADAFGTNIIKAVNMIKIGTGPSARSVPQYDKPVQPVKVKSKETVNTLKETSKFVPKEQVLPEPVIDYSVFPEQQAIYDASWDTARYLKNLEAEQNKKAINYNVDSPLWIRDPKNPNRYIVNTNRKNKPTLVTQPYKDKKQKGGPIYVTSPDDPQYQKYLATLAAKEVYAERLKFAQEQEDQTAYKDTKLNDQGRDMYDEQGNLIWEEEYQPHYFGISQPSLEDYKKDVAKQAETGNICPGCYKTVEQVNPYMIKGTRANNPKHPVQYYISPEIDLYGETQEVVVRDMNKSQPENKALRYNSTSGWKKNEITGKLERNLDRKNIPVLVTQPYKDKKQKGGRTPIYVNDPNDPRLGAYSDSLSLYNKGEKSSGLYSMNYGPAGNHRALWRNVSNTPLPEGYTVPGTIQPVGQRITQATFPRYVLAQSPATMVGTQTDYKRRVSDIYSEPVQPVIYSPDKYDPNDPRLAAYQQAFDKTFKKEPLPEVTIDPSMFPEDKPVYDTSWNTAAYVKKMNTPQPEKKIVSYQSVGQRFKKDPKTGKVVINKDFENKPIVRQKGGVAYGTPEYAAAYRKGQVARQVGDEFLMNIPNAEALAEQYAVTAVDPRSIDPVTGKRFTMWDQLPDQYKQVIEGNDPMAINARNVARLGHISADDYLAGVRDQLITTGAEATSIPAIYRLLTGEADYTDPMTYLDLLPGLGVANKTIKNVQKLRNLKKAVNRTPIPAAIFDPKTDWGKEYFEKINAYDKELQSKKLSRNDYLKRLDNYDEHLKKKLGLVEELGRGAYGSVHTVAGDASKVIKLGNPMGGGWTPELIESLKSIKQNANLAIPEQVQNFEIPSVWRNTNPSIKEALIMPNLNITKAEKLNLNKRDRYALFLKQARQLRDKGIGLDLTNYQNFKFNKDKNVFDLYDLNPNPDVNSSFNPGYYMSYIRDNTKRGMLDDMMYKYGGFKYQPWLFQNGGQSDSGTYVQVRTPEGVVKTLNTNSQEYRDYYPNLYGVNYDGTFQGKDIPEATVTSTATNAVLTPEELAYVLETSPSVDRNSFRPAYGEEDIDPGIGHGIPQWERIGSQRYPNWDGLTKEEKRLITDSGPIGNYIRSKAGFGKPYYKVNEDESFSNNLLGLGRLIYETSPLSAAQRILENPKGTLDALDQTFYDIVSSPYAAYDYYLGSGQGFSGVNPLTGKNYGEGLAGSLDVLEILPFAGAATKVAKPLSKFIKKTSLGRSIFPLLNEGNPNWLNYIDDWASGNIFQNTNEYLKVKNLKSLPNSPNTPARVLANSSRLSNVEPATGIEPVLREERRRAESFVDDVTGESGIRSNASEQISGSSNVEPIYRGVYINDEIRNSPVFKGKTDEEILDIMGTTIPGNTKTRRKNQLQQTLNFAKDYESALSHIGKHTDPSSIQKLGNTSDLTSGKMYVLKVQPDNLPFISAEQQAKLYRETVDSWKKNNPDAGNILGDDAKILNPELLKQFGESPVYRSEGVNVLTGNFPQFLGAENTKIGKLLEAKEISRQDYLNYISSLNTTKPSNLNLKNIFKQNAPEQISDNSNYFKSASDRTVPLRYDQTYDDIAAEFNVLQEMNKIAPNNVPKPKNLQFDEAGNVIGYTMEKIENHIPINDYLKTNKLSPELIKDIESTIKKFHDQGYAHGDIGSNILISNDGKSFKIIDPVGYPHSSNFSNFSEAAAHDLSSLNNYKNVPEQVSASSVSGMANDYSDIFKDPGMVKLQDFIKQGIRHELLPESKSLFGQELFNDFKKRIRTEEGRKRLKALGINDPEKFDEYILKEIQNEIAYHKDSPFHTEYIGLHKDMPENIVKKITRHELEHAIQTVLKRQDGLTEVDDILEGLDFKGTPTPKENYVAGKISDKPIKMPSTSELFSNPQRNLDYFNYGSRGKEKAAFLSEVQQAMLEDGIIDDVYQNITPEKIKEAYATYMQNSDANKYKLRMFEIINPTEENFKKLSKALNKMLVLTPIAVGASIGMQNKKVGGVVNISQLKPTQDLKKKKRKVINSIKEAIANNEKISPISVEEINGKLKIKDGHHRYVAYKEMGVDDIPVSIKYAAAGGQVDPDEAKKMLKAGSAYRKSLTDKQRRYFAETAGTDLNGNDIDSQGNIYNDDGEIIGNVNEGEYRRGGNVLGSYQEAGQVDPVAVQNRYLMEKMRVDEANRRAAELAQLAMYDDVAENMFDYSLPDMNCNIRGCQIASASGQTLAEDVEINKKKYSKGESVPVIPGIDQWIAESKKMGYNEIDANGLEPGDRVMIYTRDNSRLQHAVIYGGTDVDGNPVYYDDPGSGKEWRQADREFINSRKKRAFRYVGNLPSYENDYINIKDQLPEEEVTLPNKKETYGVRPQKEDMSLYENNPVNLHKFTNVINDPRITFYNNLMNIYSKFKKPAQQKRVQYEK